MPDPAVPPLDDPGSDLASRLRVLAATQPARPALLAPGRRAMDFGALGAQLARLSASLASWGIARGDVVAWTHEDRAVTAAALAGLPASATIAPLVASATPDVLRGILSRLAPKAVAVSASAPDAPLAQAARELGIAVLAVDARPHDVAGAFDLTLALPTRTLDLPRRFPAAWALIGATSGATGKPKLVSHGHRQVLRTAFATGERLGLGPDDVGGHVMPLHLSGGIRNGFFQPLLNGAATCFLPEAGVDALLDAIEAGTVTFTSTSFAMWREALGRLAAGARGCSGRLRFVRVASGRLEADEMDRLEEALGAPVVTGLASSETGSTAQQSPLAPRKRGSVGPPVDSEVRLVDAAGRDVRPGEVGEILVRSLQLFDGYIDDDALNAASFVDGWFRMGDLARFDDDGELHLTGRVKDVINRGGEKIAPLEIDAALSALPGVAEAASFAIPHPRLGEEVVAAVVMQPGRAGNAASMLDALRATLGARRSPRRLWFVASLPRTDAGKVRRAALPDWVGFEPAELADANASAIDGSPLERALAPLWSSALGCDRVARDAPFHALGGDDERAARLVSQVDAVFGIAFPVRALRDEAATLAAMARMIERAHGS